VGCDEFKEFGRTDACIPGRLPEIPVMKKQLAEYVLHYFLVTTTFTAVSQISDLFNCGGRFKFNSDV
jgi:hypothetical protein